MHGENRAGAPAQLNRAAISPRFLQVKGEHFEIALLRKIIGEKSYARGAVVFHRLTRHVRCNNKSNGGIGLNERT